jgi:tetratricopeptide (TPR) repeat protein
MRFVTKEGGRYYMHPVDREYALQRLTLEPSISHLQTSAADYFREIRTPRADWRTLADLAPQLAEIDLRYAAGDYDTAAQVLSGVSYDYLLMWGHYRLMIDQHERLQGKLSDQEKINSVGDLGSAYYLSGQTVKARSCYEQAVAWAREAKDKWNEVSWLGNLANCFHDVGQIHNAIKIYEPALAIIRELGDRQREAMTLGNLGVCYASMGQTRRAIENYEQRLVIDREIGNKYSEGINLGNLAQSLIDENNYLEAIRNAQVSVKIGEEIRNPQVGTEGNYSLTLAHLYSGNLVAARAAIERARQYDVPANQHGVLALLGIIALRQNDLPAAREAFTAALTHAESLLAHTPEFFEALDAKALALAGLGEIEDAQAAYQAARAITNAPGVVQRAARLLNQLEGVPKFWE